MHLQRRQYVQHHSLGSGPSLRLLHAKLLLIACAAYAQCREQLDGSWAADPSWQCQQPGDTATGGSSPSTPSTGGTPSGTGNTTTDNTGLGTGDTTIEKSGSGKTGSGLADMATDNTGSGTGDTPSNTGGSQAATIGDCNSISASGGWDGVASTSVSFC